MDQPIQKKFKAKLPKFGKLGKVKPGLYADGGAVDDSDQNPIIVHNPNDKRLLMYNDSLVLYNTGMDDLKKELSNKSAKYIGKEPFKTSTSNNNRAYDNFAPLGYNNFQEHPDPNTTKTKGIPFYKQPVQPVEYQPKPNKLNINLNGKSTIPVQTTKTATSITSSIIDKDNPANSVSVSFPRKIKTEVPKDIPINRKQKIKVGNIPSNSNKKNPVEVINKNESAPTYNDSLTSYNNYIKNTELIRNVKDNQFANEKEYTDYRKEIYAENPVNEALLKRIKHNELAGVKFKDKQQAYFFSDSIESPEKKIVPKDTIYKTPVRHQGYRNQQNGIKPGLYPNGGKLPEYGWGSTIGGVLGAGVGALGAGLVTGGLGAGAGAALGYSLGSALGGGAESIYDSTQSKGNQVQPINQLSNNYNSSIYGQNKQIYSEGGMTSNPMYWDGRALMPNYRLPYGGYIPGFENNVVLEKSPKNPVSTYVHGYANGGKLPSAYNPNLAKDDKEFNNWYSKNTLEGKNGIPYSDKLDYDYFSYYKNGETGGSPENHFTDLYKRSNHETFSNESIYSGNGAKGYWKGNTFIKYPNGGMMTNPLGANAEVEKQEVAKTPQGQTIMFDGPSHSEGGIKTNLPEGTEIASDRLINPSTGNTFAKDQKRIEMNKNKQSKRLEMRPNDKWLQKGLELNSKKSDAIFDSQEKMKEHMQAFSDYTMAMGGMIKYDDGGDIPIVGTQNYPTNNGLDPFDPNYKAPIDYGMNGRGPLNPDYQPPATNTNGIPFNAATDPAQSPGFDFKGNAGNIGLGINALSTLGQLGESFNPDPINRISNPNAQSSLNSYQGAINDQSNLRYNMNDQIQKIKNDQASTNRYIDTNIGSGSSRVGARLANKAGSIDATNSVYGESNRFNTGIQEKANQMKVGLAGYKGQLGSEDAAYQAKYNDDILRRNAALRNIRYSALSSAGRQFQQYGNDNQLMNLLPKMFPNVNFGE